MYLSVTRAGYIPGLTTSGPRRKICQETMFKTSMSSLKTYEISIFEIGRGNNECNETFEYF